MNPKFRELPFLNAKKIALDYLGQISFYGIYNRRDIYHEAFEASILKLHGIKRDWASVKDWEMTRLAHRSACKAQELIFGNADCPHPKMICSNCICFGRRAEEAEG